MTENFLENYINKYGIEVAFSIMCNKDEVPYNWARVPGMYTYHVQIIRNTEDLRQKCFEMHFSVGYYHMLAYALQPDSGVPDGLLIELQALKPKLSETPGEAFLKVAERVARHYFKPAVNMLIDSLARNEFMSIHNTTLDTFKNRLSSTQLSEEKIEDLYAMCGEYQDKFVHFVGTEGYDELVSHYIVMG